MRAYHPFRELLLDRLRQFHREPEVIFWVYVFPLLLIAGLGVAFADPGGGTSIVRVAADSPKQAERLAEALESTDGLAVERIAMNEIDAVGEGGEWDLTVVGRGGGNIEYRLDPQKPESLYARELADRALQSTAGRQDSFASETVEVREPGSRYIDWVIPGLLGLNIMGSSMWGVGFAAVDLRIRKVLKRLRATPMRRSDFLLALLASRLAFLAAEVVAILLFGTLVFGMPFSGDAGSLAALAILGAVTFASISLLAGTRARKLETISGLMNAIQVPMWLASGVFFSSERFPGVAQPLIQALPLTQLNNALRGVILHGDSVLDEWPAVAILAAWGLASFGLALRWFRWQ